MIEVELPFPPSVNHYYRHVGPRTLISREGRRFRENVASVLAGLGVQPLAGPLDVEVGVFPPDRRRRDLDNCLKSLIDAIQHGGAYEDDSQIVRLVIEKREVFPGGRVIVTIGRHRAQEGPDA